MWIYLAGPSDELDRVRRVAGVLEAEGHRITERWWERVAEAAHRGWATDAEVPPDFARVSAHRNQDGVILADVVVALCRSSGGISSGVAFELGLGVPIAREVWIVGDPRGHLAIHYPVHIRVIEERDLLHYAQVERDREAAADSEEP